jgi:tetratricopeptide (TPR) repeat protein
MHRAEVLTVRGQLEEAEAEIRAAVDMLARQAPWAEGDAWRALGEILLAKGEFETARTAFEKANDLGWESQFGLALLRLAEGDAAAAARLLGRSLAENVWSARTKRGQALAWFTIASALAGNLAAAGGALAELEADPELVSTPALQALLARARGELRAAEGHPAEAITLLRAAQRSWLELDAPLAAAQARCRVAALLASEGDPEAAKLELDAAVAAFRHAGATRLLGSCDALRATPAAVEAGRPAKAKAARAK